jgi:hypothetical protein
LVGRWCWLLYGSFAFRIVALFFGASKKNDKNKRETEKRHFLNLQESARKEKTLAPGPSLPNEHHDRSVVARQPTTQSKERALPLKTTDTSSMISFLLMVYVV